MKRPSNVFGDEHVSNTLPESIGGWSLCVALFNYGAVVRAIFVQPTSREVVELAYDNVHHMVAAIPLKSSSGENWHHGKHLVTLLPYASEG